MSLKMDTVVLRQLVVDRYTSQRDFARHCEIHESEMSKFISGGVTPCPKHQITIAQALGKERGQIWTDDSLPVPAPPEHSKPPAPRSKPKVKSKKTVTKNSEHDPAAFAVIFQAYFPESGPLDAYREFLGARGAA